MPRLSDDIEYELSKSINKKITHFNIIVEQEEENVCFSYFYDFPMALRDEDIGNVAIEMIGRLEVALDKLFLIIDDFLSEMKNKRKDDDNCKVVAISDYERIRETKGKT